MSIDEWNIIRSTATRDFKNLDFTVVADVYDHRVEFRVYDIEGWEGDKPLWHKAGVDYYPEFVDKLEDAEVYLHGGVKWDGCSNWHFDEQDRVMLHGCCKGDVQRFGDVMAACWSWTKELLLNFDGEAVKYEVEMEREPFETKTWAYYQGLKAKGWSHPEEGDMTSPEALLWREPSGKYGVIQIEAAWKGWLMAKGFM